MKLSGLNDLQRDNLSSCLDLGDITQKLLNGEFGDLEVIDIFIRFGKLAESEAKIKAKYVEKYRKDEKESLDLNVKKKHYSQMISQLMLAKEKLELASNAAILAEDSGTFKDIYNLEQMIVQISSRFVKST